MKIKLIFLFTIVFSVKLNAQWVPISNLPGAGVDGCFAVSLNGTGYVGGGIGRNTLYAYDPVTNLWTKKANVPGPSQRAWSGSFTANGNIYVVGGDTSFGGLLNDVWMYEPATDKWIQKADYPGGNRDGMFSWTFPAINLKTKVFMGGGFDGQFIGTDFYEYNPVTDTWLSMQNLPTTMLFPSTFVINNKGYVTLWEGSTYNSLLWEFDPANYSWIEKSACPASPRAEGIGFSIGNYGYVGWGQTNYNKTYNDLYRYEPINDLWTKMKDTLPANHTAWSCAFTIDNVVYAGTGATLPNFNFSTRFYKMGVTASVDENIYSRELFIWIDPHSNKLNYKTNEEILELEIYDIQGRAVLRSKPEEEHKVNVAMLSPGIYTAVFYGVSKTIVRKINVY